MSVDMSNIKQEVVSRTTKSGLYKMNHLEYILNIIQIGLGKSIPNRPESQSQYMTQILRISKRCSSPAKIIAIVNDRTTET